LYQVYDVEIQVANALVSANLRLDYGLGYYNKPYKEKSDKVVEKAERAIELLKNWLKQEGIKETTDAER